MMPNTRKNNERIREIETAIESLVKELAELVQPTVEEAVMALETMRDNTNQLWDEPQIVLGDYQICIDALDQRETDLFMCGGCGQAVDSTELHNAKSIGCHDCDAEMCCEECLITHARLTGHKVR